MGKGASHMLPSPVDDRGGSMQDITVINSFLGVLGMANGSHPCDVIRSYLLEGSIVGGMN